VKALYVFTLIVVLICVGMFCSTWGAIEFSHDAVRNRELDLQLEIAKVIGKYSKPSLSIRPDESGSQESRRDKL
jgi:hypothetical protein